MLDVEEKKSSRIKPQSASIKPPFQPPANQQPFRVKADMTHPYKAFVHAERQRHPSGYYMNQQLLNRPIPVQVHHPRYPHHMIANNFLNHPHHRGVNMPIRRQHPPVVQELYHPMRRKWPKRQKRLQQRRPAERRKSSYPDRPDHPADERKYHAPLPESEKQPLKSYPLEGQQPIGKNIDTIKEDEVQMLNATIIELKEDLAKEKERNTRISIEKRKLEEDLGVRVSLAESMNISKEEEFQLKELKLREELLSKKKKVEELKWKINRMERDVVESKKEAEEAKTHRDELASNWEEYVQKTESKNLKLESETLSIKRLYEDECTRFESERIELLTRIDRLATEVSNLKETISAKNKKLLEQKKYAEKHYATIAENCRLKDTIATQKKRIHGQEFWSEKTSELAIEVKTWKVQYKTAREEVRDLKEQVGKLQGEKKELKKKVKMVKSSEKVMATFENVELKSKEYFEKMLNYFGEVQELRERLSKATQDNNSLKCKLKIMNDWMENDEHKSKKSDFGESVWAHRNVLWSQLCELSSINQENIVKNKKTANLVENLQKRERRNNILLKRYLDLIFVLWSGTLQKYLEIHSVPAIKQKHGNTRLE